MCFAIDPTGAHILNEKVRGKLLTIEKPKIVLLTRGRVAKEFNAVDGDAGWTMVRPLAGRTPSPEYFDSIRDALVRLATEAGSKPPVKN
jgi:type III restriction enzyme